MSNEITTPYDRVLIDPNEPLILPDGTAITGRLETFLYALCCLDYDNLPTPLSRIEEFANALITGEIPNIEPQSRSEQFFLAILDGNIDNLPEPQSRSEVLLNKLAVGDFDLTNVDPIQSRYELLLAYLIKNGGVGNLDYVLYEFYQATQTLYNTQEKPVKSAILKGSTKYRDIDTGDILDTFDETKNLELVSVKMPVLKTTGKNLFDGKLEYGIINGGNGLPYNSNDYVRTQDFIPINCEKITYTVINEQCGLSFYFYDKDKKFISSVTMMNVKENLSIPEGVAYLKFRTYPLSNESVTTNLNTQIQIEEGSVATEYESFKSNILTCNEDVTLRSNGNICDELNLLTGQLTQRIDEDGEVLSQEVVKTVDLSVVNQDGNNTKLSTFNDITHVTLSSEGLIPEAEMTVTTKNEEVLNTMSLEMEDISTTQTALEETSNTQSENVDATMMTTTEIYEELL